MDTFGSTGDWYLDNEKLLAEANKLAADIEDLSLKLIRLSGLDELVNIGMVVAENCSYKGTRTADNLTNMSSRLSMVLADLEKLRVK